MALVSARAHKNLNDLQELKEKIKQIRDDLCIDSRLPMDESSYELYNYLKEKIEFIEKQQTRLISIAAPRIKQLVNDKLEFVEQNVNDILAQAEKGKQP